MMDTRSEAALALVCPELATKVRVASDTLNVDGTYILVVSGLRTAEQQNRLYAQGRTAPGHIVTNARAGQSMHCYGLAVDVVPYLAGANGNLNWNSETPQFIAMVTALKAQGLDWGGDWAGKLIDRDHFQMPGFPTSPSQQMVSVYQTGEDAYKTLWPVTVA